MTVRRTGGSKWGGRLGGGMVWSEKAGIGARRKGNRAAGGESRRQILWAEGISFVFGLPAGGMKG